MAKNTTAQPLTNREYDIMSILWESNIPLVASEIAKMEEDLTINTVQAVLKKLISKKLIKVNDIVYSGTVLTRNYVPTVTKDEFELNYLLTSFQCLSNKRITTSNFVASLLEQETDSKKLLSELDSLENVLEAKRKLMANKK